jgi:hypothetical protein
VDPGRPESSQERRADLEVSAPESVPLVSAGGPLPLPIEELD